MPNHEHVSKTDTGWDKERAWKVTVRLAETHQKLQAKYTSLMAQGNPKPIPIPRQQANSKIETAQKEHPAALVRSDEPLE
jgi:hypothetical protein